MCAYVFLIIIDYYCFRFGGLLKFLYLAEFILAVWHTDAIIIFIAKWLID